MRFRIFISSVQKEFAEERRRLMAAERQSGEFY